MRTLLVIAALSLTACMPKVATVLPDTPTTKDELHKVKETVDVDSRLLQPCRPLEIMLVTNPTPKDILIQHGKDVVVHDECLQRNSKMIDLVKKAFNIK